MATENTVGLISLLCLCQISQSEKDALKNKYWQLLTRKINNEYKTATIVRGLALTEEERREAEEMIEKVEKELAEMPEAQRQLVEQMMGDKIAKFRKMLEEDQYEAVTRVKEVKVNTGLEDFD